MRRGGERLAPGALAGRKTVKRTIAKSFEDVVPAQDVDAPNSNDETPVKRRKAGRPKGSFKYSEPVKTVRVPVSVAPKIDSFIERGGDVVPLYESLVQAGFPSPAEDVPHENLDLGEFLMPNPPATFFVRATGESMRDAGIFPGDVLIVDRSIEPANGDVVIAAVDGDFTVKRLFKTQTRVELRPENSRFRPIVINDDMELVIWGVVRKVIHTL